MGGCIRNIQFVTANRIELRFTLVQRFLRTYFGYKNDEYRLYKKMYGTRWGYSQVVHYSSSATLNEMKLPIAFHILGKNMSHKDPFSRYWSFSGKAKTAINICRWNII